MSKDPNRFTESTKTTLAKRAGYRCSNPHCRTPTSGPHLESDKSINIGEAAHIRGANPGSCRFEITMTPEERSVITNAIWLCRKCARLIDTDSKRYTVDILYKWKMVNEDEIFSEIEGSTEKSEIRKLIIQSFKDEPRSSLQIAIDKPDYWEYLLTVDLLRYKFSGIKKRFNRLERGLEYKPSKAVHGFDFLYWFNSRLTDLTSIIDLFKSVISIELKSSFGEPGEEGNALEVLDACNLIEKGCNELIEWEREVKYTLLPGEFEDIKKMLLGWSNCFIDEMDKIHKEIAAIFDQNPTPEGIHEINIIFDVPNNFEEVATLTMERLENYLSSQ